MGVGVFLGARAIVLAVTFFEVLVPVAGNVAPVCLPIGVRVYACLKALERGGDEYGVKASVV